MTARSELSEFLPAYVNEVEELIAAARTGLIAIEGDARRGIANLRGVREIFRAVHTIKGLSAMVDVAPVMDLAHAMEASLRDSERGGAKLSEAATEAYLKGLAVIEGCIQALSAGTPLPQAPRAVVDALQALLKRPEAHTGTTDTQLIIEPALDAKLSAADREQLYQGVVSGRRMVRLDFAPSPASAAAGRTITAIRERVAKVAEVVKVVPLGMPISTKEPGGLIFALLLLSRETDPAIAAAAGLPAENVRTLGQVSGPLPAAALAPIAFPEPLSPDAVEGIIDPSSRLGVVRVETDRLDLAIDCIGGLIVNRSRLVRAVASLNASGADTRELAVVLNENARLLRDARASVLRLRMVRVAEVLERLPLIVRQLRKSTGKDIALQLDVGHAELDKAVGDRLFPALVHLVRNAVDHGIESSEQRLGVGKPAEGSLRISCRERSSSRLELVIEDDGRGIDADEVVLRAQVAPGGGAEQLLELLCRPGLSTRDEATLTSGRGMGMDIVKRIVVDQLGGELRLETTPGKGTTFTIDVPLTISILDVFVFEASTEQYAVAVSSVDELFEVDPSLVIHSPAPRRRRRQTALVGMVERHGQALPLVRLEALLNGSHQGSAAKAMVVRHRKQSIAFAVDRLLSQQEVVIRPLEDPLVQVPGVAGATDLGDGRPTLVLDMMALSALSMAEHLS